jgi:hypothetical protein
MPRDATIIAIVPPGSKTRRSRLSNLRRRGFAVPSFSTCTKTGTTPKPRSFLAEGIETRHLKGEQSVMELPWLCACDNRSGLLSLTDTPRTDGLSPGSSFPCHAEVLPENEAHAANPQVLGGDISG